MNQVIEFHTNHLADGKLSKENKNVSKDTFFDKIKNSFHKGTYCVRRCGFYKNRYTIMSKKEMIEREEYEDLTGCNGVPWKASEGSYSDCMKFIMNNNKYVHIDRDF